MTARYQQEEIGEFDLVRQAGREGMAFEVVDGDEGDFLGGGNGFARHHADHDAADQPWAAGGGDAVELFKFEFCFVHGGLDEGVKVIDVGARGEFGYDAAKGFVLFELGENEG